MILKVRDISFHYNGTPVLEGISFEVNPHEITAILGPNGAGKTTLLKNINGILHPNQGSVFIEQTDLLRCTPKEIARKTAYVAQRGDPGRMTAFDTVLLGRKPHLKWGPGEQDYDLTRLALRRLKLEKLALRYTDRMSGGEYQKVCIARSLAQEPMAMLLDEPTSSLDLKNQISILKLLREIVRDHYMCVLMSMHDLNTAFRYADKFIFLKNGKIHAHVDKKHITREIIEEVYEVEVSMQQHDGYPVIIPTDA
jgi:iron complex transport system ATP-binding protein